MYAYIKYSLKKLSLASYHRYTIQHNPTYITLPCTTSPLPLPRKPIRHTGVLGTGFCRILHRVGVFPYMEVSSPCLNLNFMARTVCEDCSSGSRIMKSKLKVRSRSLCTWENRDNFRITGSISKILGPERSP